MERLTFNIGGGAIRREDLKGRRHMVVPMVMLVEGVVPGSNGPLLYPGEEVERWAPSWNYRPIVSYHPEQNGQGVSACDPLILDTQEVGVTMNIVCDDQPNTGLKRWRGQAWLDEERLQKIDSDTYDALMRNEKVEVSTGLYTENEQTPGEFKGESYTAIARNYKPDHLAILFGKQGACSVAQGAGLLQLNRAGGVNVEETTRRINEAVTNAVEEASRDYWELSLNEWSDAAREAAIKARQAGAKGPAKPTNVRISKRLGQSWLHSKGHDTSKMSRAEMHEKLKEYAKDKKHHGALRELARDTEGEKRGMPPRAHHAPKKAESPKADSPKSDPKAPHEERTSDKRTNWQKDFEAGQAASRKVDEERKGKVQPSRHKTPEEEKHGVVKSKPAPAPEPEAKPEEAKAAPTEKKPKAKKEKYKDSGKREPVIPSSWKGKYASKDTKRLSEKKKAAGKKTSKHERKMAKAGKKLQALRDSNNKKRSALDQYSAEQRDIRKDAKKVGVKVKRPKKRPTRNAWSEAARDAAALARRWRGQSGKDLTKKQKRILAKSARVPARRPWNGASESFSDSAAAVEGFHYANEIGRANRSLAVVQRTPPEDYRGTNTEEYISYLRKEREKGKVRMKKRLGINAWSPQAREAAKRARRKGGGNSDVYAGALMEEYVGHRKEGKDHDRAMRRVKATHSVTMGTSGGGSGSFQKGYGAFKQRLASSKIYGAEVSASARARAEQVASEFLNRPKKHVIV